MIKCNRVKQSKLTDLHEFDRISNALGIITTCMLARCLKMHLKYEIFFYLCVKISNLDVCKIRLLLILLVVFFMSSFRTIKSQ